MLKLSACVCMCKQNLVKFSKKKNNKKQIVITAENCEKLWLCNSVYKLQQIQQLINYYYHKNYSYTVKRLSTRAK